MPETSTSSQPPTETRRLWRLGLIGALIGGLIVWLLQTIAGWAVAKASDYVWENRPSSRGQVILAVFPRTGVSQPMKAALRLEEPIEGIPLELLPEASSVEETIDQLLNRLDDPTKPEVILAIGHERSTVVLELLPRVYQRTGRGQPIPVILPAVTNPAITETQAKGQRHILRLPPTDDKQVFTLACLLRHLQVQDVTLLVDNGNLAYSSFIAKELVYKSTEPPPISIVDSVGVDLVTTGFSPTRLLDAKPSTVVFIGMETEASLFLRRLRRSDPPPRFGPSLNPDLGAITAIFTDGVAGTSFENVTRSLLQPGEELYLTGPFPPSTLASQTSLPTYAPYAAAARAIASHLVLQAKKNGASPPRRSDILAEVQQLQGATPYMRFASLEMQFDAKGDNTLAEFHAYRITHDQVEQVKLTCGTNASSNRQ